MYVNTVKELTKYLDDNGISYKVFPPSTVAITEKDPFPIKALDKLKGDFSEMCFTDEPPIEVVDLKKELGIGFIFWYTLD